MEHPTPSSTYKTLQNLGRRTSSDLPSAAFTPPYTHTLNIPALLTVQSPVPLHMLFPLPGSPSLMALSFQWALPHASWLSSKATASGNGFLTLPTKVNLTDKEMATHSSTLAWKTRWTEKPGRLQSMGSQRVGHNWVTSLSLSICSYSSTPAQCHKKKVNLTLLPQICVPTPGLYEDFSFSLSLSTTRAWGLSEQGRQCYPGMVLHKHQLGD